ncbi:hypothetical protein [Nostoc sp.]
MLAFYLSDRLKNNFILVWLAVSADYKLALAQPAVSIAPYIKTTVD